MYRVVTPEEGAPAFIAAKGDRFSALFVSAVRDEFSIADNQQRPDRWLEPRSDGRRRSMDAQSHHLEHVR
ncbi:hypothetical protein ATB98_21330 [Sinorhizobium saheli]|uniref:Uncharacterized protein n=1 Tax=Sinorhizobium saheli TaxID=36856 RepID=A0A178YMT7_SINSA|nr:hypothetical protein ATB98_21330 [Sinorhizobium saheli]